MKYYRILGFMAAATLFCVADRSDAEEEIPGSSSLPPADPERPVVRELELLKRRIEELEAAKRAHEDAARTLNQRLKELETAKLAHERATRMLKRRLEDLEAAKIVRDDTAREDAAGTLKRRIDELEKAKLAHEDATRTIIRQSFAERGSSINDYVDFGGTIEALSFRAEDFGGRRESDILLDTAEIDFKIHVNDWVSGSLVLQHEEGPRTRFASVSRDALPPTTPPTTTPPPTTPPPTEPPPTTPPPTTPPTEPPPDAGGPPDEGPPDTGGPPDEGPPDTGSPLDTTPPTTQPTTAALVAESQPTTAALETEPQSTTAALGTEPQLTTAALGTEPDVIDRINVREAYVTIGNTQRFPLFATVGRLTVPFGISTGDPVTDALTIIDPLTIEVFEAREDVVMFGLELPTPPPPLPLETVVAPIPALVEPLLFRPLVRKFSTWLCSYLSCYPPPPKPVLPTIPPAGLPPFTAAVYLYNGDTFDAGGDHIENMGATVGYRTRGMFSGPRIPWSIDFDVDINNSVFDSNFLQFEYQPFLDQIGYVAGMAAHLKSNLGPIGLLLEWNRAIDDAGIIDDRGQAFSIRPGAWQAQFAYQFDYNPAVEVIGAQGTYFVVGYSESQDLAGVAQRTGDPLAPTAIRVGSVPEKRLNVGVGEWVLDGLRIAIEYSRNWDYSIAEGGTGNSADGVFMQLTYEW